MIRSKKHKNNKKTYYIYYYISYKIDDSNYNFDL